jgi:hypothetical protein
MGTEQNKIQDPGQNERGEQVSERHLKAVSEEQEQVKELLRRGTIRHYFLGPETIWTREGFGIVVGGGLTIFFGGFIFPQLFRYAGSTIPNIVLKIMIVIGFVVLGKGLYTMYKESKSQSKIISDREHDEILEHDIEVMKKTGIEMMQKHVPAFRDGQDPTGMETLFLKGPRIYSAFSNLPLLWKRGEDGRLRYSNFSVMNLYFGKDTLYVHTCIYNMRNGAAKFHHTYECSYAQIRRAELEDRKIETVDQSNKAIVQHLKVLVIDAGDGENDQLVIPVADLDAMKQYNGSFDIKDAEHAAYIIKSKIPPQCKQAENEGVNIH